MVNFCGDFFFNQFLAGTRCLIWLFGLYVCSPSHWWTSSMQKSYHLLILLQPTSSSRSLSLQIWVWSLFYAIAMHTSQRDESFLRGQKRDKFETFFQLWNILCSNFCIRRYCNMLSILYRQNSLDLC